MGIQLPLPQRGTAPTQFSAHICCGQMAGWIKMSLGMEVDLYPGHIVLDGDPAPPPQKTKFSAHVYCGQTTGWIKMVGLSPVDLVLDGNPPTLNFRPMFIIIIVISLEHCAGVRRYWFVQVQVQV